MRFAVAVAVVALAAAASIQTGLAGEPYTPARLKPAETVDPPAELLDMARQFLEAVQKGDGDLIDAAIADKVTAIDGALELTVKRRKEVLGPYDRIEDMLVALANYIGGIYEQPADGGDATPFAIEAEREYIVGSLTDGQSWGTDPMLKGAICTYAYRSFDAAAVGSLSETLNTASSSFFYVDAPAALLAEPKAGAPIVATLETDRLYGLDYKTDAPRHWIAVHLPEGGSGFVNFDEVALEKPYAAGICFSKGKDGKWVMSAQVSTSL